MSGAALRIVLLALALSGWGSARAQVAVPPLNARVTDQAGLLQPAQVQALEQTLQAFETSKGSQIAVLIVPTTAPESIEQYGIRVASQWHLGRKGVDDGALLLVAKDDHAVRIEVGYGLEGVLNDAVSARIVREIIVPRFQQGDFNGGISDGVARMIGVVDGEPLPAPKPAGGASRPQLGPLIPVLLFIAFVGGSIGRAIFGRVPGAVVTGGVLAFVAWALVGTIAVASIAGVVGFLFTLAGGAGGALAGGGRGGYWGGGGGGFGGGFGGGGGFSGGGGGFGGGGASGRW